MKKLNKKGGVSWVLISIIVAIVGLIALVPFINYLQSGGQSAIDLTGVNKCSGTGLDLQDYTFWLNALFREKGTQLNTMDETQFDKKQGIDFCEELLSCFGSEKRWEKTLKNEQTAACCLNYFPSQMEDYLAGEYQTLTETFIPTRCRI